MTPSDFIALWKASQGREESNSGPFLHDLCLAFGLPTPGPWTGEYATSPYTLESPINVTDSEGRSSTKKIDLYKRGSFILEAKQASDDTAEIGFELTPSAKTPKSRKRNAPPRANTSRIIRGRPGWRKYLDDARAQAESYARNLPGSEPLPPLIIVADIGYLFEFYHNFRDSSRAYEPLKIWRNSHVIRLDDLADPAIGDLLRTVWNDPRALDPTARQSAVTRTLAKKLGNLAQQIDDDRKREPATTPSADSVADFLIRALFTMFAEDVGLLPEKSFTQLLGEIKEDPQQVADSLTALWREMNGGGYSPTLRKRIPRFNGRVFAGAEAIPLSTNRMDYLIEAAHCDWSHVDPSIFGSLLENALDDRKRSAEGAHYTPRAYVERLVKATIEEPLRAEWSAALAKATADDERNDRKSAIVDTLAFLRRLAAIKILDPACGTGNFLVVAFEVLKSIEAEALRFLREILEHTAPVPASHQVTTSQFLGIEVNPRAARIAELVLNLAALQWFFANRKDPADMPPEPIIPEGRSIECRDAALTWSRIEPVLDEHLRPRTRWDGFTMKKDQVTGREIPDESARAIIEKYHDPRPAEWPQADFIVGNPPFVGGKDIRVRLGDGYVEALWAAYPELPNSCDFVMYWWHKAAEAVRTGQCRRFGFVTTNSITQTFSRRVLEHHLKADPPLSLEMAIPDHPWTTGDKAAAVRIAMTVGVPGQHPGILREVQSEKENANDGEGYQVTFREMTGSILPDLTVGADVAGAKALRANEKISSPGVKLHGDGFIVTPEEAERLGLGRIPGLERHIRPYRNGRDLTATPRGVMVIDLFGLTEAEVMERFPEVYQHIFTRVKPERDAKSHSSKDSAGYAKLWWLFGKPRQELRKYITGLSRYIATVETAKHRVFQFLDISILPDNKLIAIASDDAFVLGVLSSKIHVSYSLVAGGWLGYGNDPVYVKTRCFEPFPFPDATDAQKARIREIAERLDAHRKRQQELHPGLTLTEMYNALEALRSGVNLQETDAKGKKTHAKLLKAHDDGLVSILKMLHDQLDAAVAEAYGWPADLPEPEILTRLVALNTHRHAEEQAGHIRWIRPEYQGNL